MDASNFYESFSFLDESFTSDEIHDLERSSLHTASLSPHITSVQYCGGCSVHWRLFSTSGDNISTEGG